MSDYTVTRYSDDVELLIRKNTQLFSERMALLLDKVQEAEGVPICVSQPHLFTIDTDGQLKGVSKVMEHEGKSYSGLDYDASIKSLNKEMKRICTLKGGIYVDMATKKFAPGDFYDSVHTTPAGAKRLGEYFFDEFNP